MHKNKNKRGCTRLGVFLGPLLGLLLVLSAWRAAAHEVRPAYLELIETPGPRYTMTWKLPVRAGGVLALTPVLPEACREIDLPRIDYAPGARPRRVTLDRGPNGLLGREIAIQGLPTSLVDVLVRLEFRNGDSRTHLPRPMHHRTFSAPVRRANRPCRCRATCCSASSTSRGASTTWSLSSRCC